MIVGYDVCVYNSYGHLTISYLPFVDVLKQKTQGDRTVAVGLRRL